MPIGWLTVLQSVPWSEVIKNAPKVAEGAKKLWKAVAGNPPAREVSGSDAQAAPYAEAGTLATLEARVVATEAAISDLHGQMLASSELIKALADQNAQLIRRIETHRVRVIWLMAVVAMVVALTVAAVLGLLPVLHQ